MAESPTDSAFFFVQIEIYLCHSDERSEEESIIKPDVSLRLA